MNNKPLVIVIVLMLLTLAGFGVVYYKKHHPSATDAALIAQQQAAGSVPAVPSPQAAPAYTPPVTKAQEVVAPPVFYLQQQMKGLRNSITAAMNKQQVTLYDLEKLDFGGANAPDPAYAVFNPQGKIRFAPASGKWFGQDLIDRIAKVKGTKLVYILRRTTDAKGAITDVLYAIIPNVDAANCGPVAGNTQYNYAGAFKLAKDNHTIIEDPADMPIMQIGCLLDSSQTFNWVYRLKLRTTTGAGKIWGSY